MAKVESLSAITLHVADMVRSRAFYGGLGLDVVHTADAFTSYAVGGGYLNLQAHPGPQQASWGRVILYCDDVDATLAAAVDAGGVPQGQAADASWGERYVHVLDPDGHEISLARPLAWPVFRTPSADDSSTLLAMNQAEVPAVGPLDPTSFAALVDRAAETIVIWLGGQIAGFAVLFKAGSDYASPNYRWFADRIPAFVYVDRVVVSPNHQRQGIGRRLYQQIIDRAGSLPVLAEVNTRPPNPTSLAFHDTMGFVEVGRVDLDNGKEVAMLRHDPARSRAPADSALPYDQGPWI